MEKLVSLCKRRGFIFQSSEIYGGINACWDYGPLGVHLKNNVKRLWWKEMTQRRDDVEGLDAAILMHPTVWKASGHVEAFTDPMVDCKTCKPRFRADEIKKEGQCPSCGNKTLSDIRQFNLMFKTFMGPVEEDAAVVYLRPETCQGIYVNFENVRITSRQKIPFGIAQIGKSFRNEISPGNFIFRTREFEQMEMQFFVHPAEADKWFEYWKEKRMDWYLELGIRKEKLRFRDHASDELAHYARRAVDIEYEFPFGWKELEGIHNRGDYDLTRHKEFSGKDLSYFDDATKERFIPYIIETSGGDRPRAPGLSFRRLRRGAQGGKAGPGGNALSPQTGSDQAGRPAPGQPGRDGHTGPEAGARPAQAFSDLLRRRRDHRQALPQTGRGRDPVRCHGGFPDLAGRYGDPQGPGHDGADPGAHEGPCGSSR